MNLCIYTDKSAPEYTVYIDDIKRKETRSFAENDYLVKCFDNLSDTDHKISVKINCLSDTDFWFLRALNPIRFLAYTFFKRETISVDNGSILNFNVLCQNTAVNVFLDYKVTIGDFENINRFEISKKQRDSISNTYHSKNERYYKHIFWERAIPPCCIVLLLLFRLINTHFDNSVLVTVSIVYTLLFFVCFIWKRKP